MKKDETLLIHFFLGKSLDDKETIGEYGILPNSIITLVISEGAPLETDKWLPFRYRYNLLIGVGV